MRKRKVETADEKLAWLIIAASVPTGILGLVLEHPVRVGLAKPTAAAIFLMVNGVILISTERLQALGPDGPPRCRDPWAGGGRGGLCRGGRDRGRPLAAALLP